MTMSGDSLKYIYSEYADVRVEVRSPSIILYVCTAVSRRVFPIYLHYSHPTRPSFRESLSEKSVQHSRELLHI